MQHNSRFLALIEEAKNRVQQIEQTELLSLLKDSNLILIDVREKEEFNRGHLPNAIHLSKGVLERDIEKVIPNPEAPIIVYCSGGYRSVLAADNVQKMGYRHVRSLIGGCTQWQKNGFPFAQ